jgi:hypothetical protein
VTGRARLGELLRPRAVRRVAGWESALVLLGATAVAFLRLGTDVRGGKVWAEDGAVFLAGAQHSNLLTGLFDPYAGYGHLLPRIEAELVSWLPVATQGLGLNLAAALTQGAVALLAYHVVSARSRHRLTPAFAALAVAAVPVGHEVVVSLANDQWFLLIGGTLAPLWSPHRLPGRVLSVAVLVAAAASCPFGFVCVGIAFVVWLVGRDRDALVLAGAGAVAVVVQAIVMIAAPPRAQTEPFGNSDLVAGYLRRVLGDGVLGSGRHDDLVAAGVVAGVVVLVLVVAACACVVAGGRGDAVVVPAVLLGVSLVLYAAPIVISRAPTDFAVISGRYFVAPTALFLIALVLLADTLTVRSGLTLANVGAATVGGLVVLSVVGIAGSWQIRDDDPRRSALGWHAQVQDARDWCARHPARQKRPIDISPPGWQVSLPCESLR